MSQDNARRRVFIFYPVINERIWRVLVPGGAIETFASEGRAVEFALGWAATAGAQGIVDVVRQTISGGWVPVLVPGRTGGRLAL